MLSAEDNELLCRVGPDTPMGKVFRRFWLPISLAEQAPAAGGDPVRVKMLGERLVLFRDGAGRIGLVDEGCLHRRVSLALGRIEEDGIRCLYHGWKFGVGGEVLDTPNHKDRRIRERLRTRAYPVREAAGLVWAYMGPAELQPDFPNWSFMRIPRENLKVVRIDSASNFMQILEGGADTSHVGILHTNSARPGWMNEEFVPNAEEDNPAALESADLAPELQIEDTEFGFHYAAVRPLASRGGHEQVNIRLVPIVMPTIRVIPSKVMQSVIYEVPMDDENTASFSIAFRSDGQPFDTSRYDEIRGRDNPKMIDMKSWRYLGTWDNRFGQDRQAMQDNWTGIRGVVMEDMAMSMSPGPIVDRSAEHLVGADSAVVRARRQLLDSARRIATGEEPIGVRADLSGVIACDQNIPVTQPWQDLAPGHRQRRS